mmetsp:Transcript_5136/g.14942  ORF Transcript_5136/g.14942 Transcript_5136/m.14942 type:complete len:207 (-) Transcript_5136:182-802(-)
MIRYSDRQPLSFLFLDYDVKVIINIYANGIVVLPVVGSVFSSIGSVFVGFFVLERRRKRCPRFVLPLPEQVLLFPFAEFVLAAVLVSLGRSRQHHVDNAHQHHGLYCNVQGILPHQIPPPRLVQTRQCHQPTNQIQRRHHQDFAVGHDAEYRLRVYVRRVHLPSGVIDEIRNGLADLESQLVDGRKKHLCDELSIGLVVSIVSHQR